MQGWCRLAVPSASSLSAFLGASLVLALSPGPGVLYILGCALSGGRRAALGAVAGIAAGNLGSATAVALGLALLADTLPAGLAILRWAGAGYLAWLGLRTLRPLPGTSTPVLRRRLGEAALVSLLNPKTALFFATFLPQFLPARGPVLGPALALGTLFVLVAACTDSVYALCGARLAQATTPRVQALGRWLAGCTLLGLAAAVALGSGLSGRP